MHASTSSAATARRAPAVRAVSRNAGLRRWRRARALLLLPPPLWGRACPRLDRGVGEGGQHRQPRVQLPPPPAPRRKGEGSGEAPARLKLKERQPPASCWLLHFPTRSRATAA